eukprot:6464878-Amphidinium_carterae.1
MVWACYLSLPKVNTAKKLGNQTNTQSMLGNENRIFTEILYCYVVLPIMIVTRLPSSLMLGLIQSRPSAKSGHSTGQHRKTSKYQE